jgi:lysophospholipase L1-like esterase
LSLALCLLVIFFLFLLSSLPPASIGQWHLRKIDLLSEVRRNTTDTNKIEKPHERSPLLADVKIEAPVTASGSPCGEVITCIEDYGRSKISLQKFMKALKELKKGNKAVRIAMYGDSFIEGDVFCGSLRDSLQKKFGGSGVGFVPVTSQVTGFRNTIKHKFENWKTCSLITPQDSAQRVEIGPAGFSFLPETDNWLQYKPSKQRNYRHFSWIKLYYQNTGSAVLTYAVNDSLRESVPLEKSARLREWKLRYDKAKVVEFEFSNTDSFEATEGIYVDNFSMRGNSGIFLTRIPDQLFVDFNRYRNYKLIILQYGLNIVKDDSSGYDAYAARMVKVVNKLKQVYPEASILLLSVSDRSTNIEGRFRTAKSIPTLRDAQRYIAKSTGVAFWDMYEAMGGENSMIQFVHAKPALAAKDYTHVNFKGGGKLAGLLARSILYEFEKFEQKNKTN